MLDDDRRRGHLVTAAMFFVAFYAWGTGFYGLGLYLRELRELHGWSLGAMTALTFLFHGSAVVFAYRVGRLLNRDQHRVVLLYGAVAMGAGLIALGRVNNIALAVLAYLVMASGWACLNAQTISSAIMRWYPDNAATPLALALTGASIGGAALIPVFRTVTDRWGFASATTAVGLSQILVIWLATLLLFKLPLETDAQRVAAADSSVATREVIRQQWFWPVAMGAGLSIGAQVGFLVHQLSVLDAGLTPTRAAAVVSFTTIAAVIGRLVFAQLSVWLPFWVLGAAFLSVQILGFLVMAADLEGERVLTLGSVAVGSGVGVMITIPPLMARNVFSHIPFGSVFPSVAATTQTCVAFSPVLVTVTHQLSGGYGGALLALAGIDTVALVCIVAATKSRG